ncbi:fimbrial protein [Rahnella sp. PD12R]|uniref:fimbrial protein n=1 Tax=Rahnella sp. PD12R TaxID=2855688 RepID=UPI001C47A61E|nr:fimbrial protein [Rahnella sp. PD12R]MBV6817991.1 fimbrial protein [Rahnella sp. PD12R]
MSNAGKLDMKYHKTMKLVFIFIGIFILTKNSAMAMSCSVNVSSYTLNVGNIIVQRDAVIGQAISSEISGGPSSIYTCTSSGSEGFTSGIKSYLTYNSTASDGRRIYNTGIPGVGVVIGGNPHTCGTSYIGNPRSAPTGIDWVRLCTWSTVPGGVQSWSLNPTVQFYKTASSSSGTLPAQIAGFMAMNSSGGELQPEVPVNITGSVTTVACSINTPNILVPLADVPASDFISVGTTAKPKSFDVGLNCDAGAKVNAKLSGTPNTDTTNTSVLQLTGAGGNNVATGVGIQILYNNSPVALNTNMLLKTSDGGQETFPFTAQYYQTQAAVTAGSANTTATLELTYQ